MAVSRRGFLRLLSASAVVLASPTSFFDMGPSVALGSARGYNSFLSIDWITREALKVLNNNLTFAQCINRDYDQEYNHLVSAQAEALALEPKAPLVYPGAIFTVPGTFQVDPRTRMSLPGQLQQFRLVR